VFLRPRGSCEGPQRFRKTNDKLVLKAGSYAGKVLDKAGVQALASIPSREELLSKLLYVMKAPVTGFAVCLGALAKQREEAPLEPYRIRTDLGVY
jgi:large subunit ribosomal protein L10